MLGTYHFQRLFVFRSAVLGSELLVITLAVFWLDEVLPVHAMLSVIAVYALFNLMIWLRLRKSASVSANEFFLHVRKTALQPGEFLTRIDIPLPPQGWVGRYLKLGRNAGGDLAIVGTAVLGYPDPSATSGYRFRLALASVAPTPIRVPEAETLLAEEPINAGALSQAALAAQAAAKPIDDLRSSARYRKAMVRNLTRRALDDIWQQLQEER